MIKNYTSNSKTTFDKIQKILVDHNAKSINFEYKDGRVNALIFVLEINEQEFGFKMPARVEQVETIFFKNKKRRYDWQAPTPLTDPEKEQAYRTAWANIRDWIDAQMALIETEQAKIEEVFLPFLVVDGKGQTLFEKYKDSGFKRLAGGDESVQGEIIQ